MGERLNIYNIHIFVTPRDGGAPAGRVEENVRTFSFTAHLTRYECWHRWQPVCQTTGEGQGGMARQSPALSAAIRGAYASVTTTKLQRNYLCDYLAPTLHNWTENAGYYRLNDMCRVGH